jgi:hypothetical protein
MKDKYERVSWITETGVKKGVVVGRVNIAGRRTYKIRLPDKSYRHKRFEELIWESK